MNTLSNIDIDALAAWLDARPPMHNDSRALRIARDYIGAGVVTPAEFFTAWPELADELVYTAALDALASTYEGN